MALQKPQEETRPIDLDAPQDHEAISQKRIAEALASIQQEGKAAYAVIAQRYPQPTISNQ